MSRLSELTNKLNSCEQDYNNLWDIISKADFGVLEVSFTVHQIDDERKPIMRSNSFTSDRYPALFSQFMDCVREDFINVSDKRRQIVEKMAQEVDANRKSDSSENLHPSYGPDKN